MSYRGFWEDVATLLTVQMKGGEQDEALMDKVTRGAIVMAGATLVRAGMDADTVIDRLAGEDYVLKLAYDRDEDAFSIAIEWGDGEVTPLEKPADEVGVDG